LFGPGLLAAFVLVVATLRHLLVGGRDERLLLLVVDDLRVDVLGAAEDGEARTLGRAGDALARRAVPLLAALFLVADVREHVVSPLDGLAAASAAATRGAGLADLPLDRLLDVLDALALVGLRGPELADLGDRLAEHVLVRARERDAVLVDLARDAL